MKRGSLRADEAFLRERAAKQARWARPIPLPAHVIPCGEARHLPFDIQKTFPPERGPKYRNEKTDGYDSKREAKRATDLRMLQSAGYISELREQVKYLLIPAQYVGGECVERACTYTADFVYQRDGKTVVEDAKAVRTQQYVIRRKLMLMVHGVRVVEV